MTKNRDNISQPLVSVIINCCNGEKYLQKAIDSVYEQTYQNWEIVFWDNVSTDRSADIAKTYDARLKYFRGKEYVPLGAARNKALDKCCGEFIAFLDCDDLWMPEKLEKQILLFKEPDIGLVYCDSIWFNEDDHRINMYSFRKHYTGNCFRQLLTDFSLSLSTIVIRRRALEGLDECFDERFNVLEDADLFKRIAFLWKFAFVNEPLAEWRVHSNSLTWSKADLFVEENEILLEKFRMVIPCFEQDYAVEIRQVEKRITFIRARQYWKKGKGAQARIELIRNMPDKKSMALFMLSFLPIKLGEKLVTMVRGDILPN